MYEYRFNTKFNVGGKAWMELGGKPKRVEVTMVTCICRLGYDESGNGCKKIFHLYNVWRFPESFDEIMEEDLYETKEECEKAIAKGEKNDKS